MEKASKRNIQARHDERRQRRIREQRVRRYTFFSVLGIIIVFLIMFCTPLFNIKNVEIKGNNRLTNEQIITEVGEIKGENLFRAGGGVKKKLKKYAYVEKAAVKKKLIPPTLIIEIDERLPAIQFEYAESFMVLDAEGRVLEKRNEKLENVPFCEGLKIVSANEGEFVSFKDSEMQKIILECIQNLQKADIINDITVLSFVDMTNITFNYQSRLDVICGTHIDFSRKLNLFKEAVNSNKLTQNSRGTINLSTTGKAIYTP